MIRASSASRLTTTIRDQLAGQRRRLRVALEGEVALEDRIRRALPELGLEHRRERQPATGSAAPDAVVAAGSRLARRASASDAIDQDGDGAELHAEQPLHGGADRLADLGVSGTSGWRGRATRRTVTSTRPSRMRTRIGDPPRTSRQRRPAATDAQHAGHLERGQPHRLADHARADRQHRDVTGSPPRSRPARPRRRTRRAGRRRAPRRSAPARAPGPSPRRRGPRARSSAAARGRG